VLAEQRAGRGDQTLAGVAAALDAPVWAGLLGRHAVQAT
jgi:hypothetical protein